MTLAWAAAAATVEGMARRYLYRCTECGTRLEVLAIVADRQPAQTCPDDGTRLVRDYRGEAAGVVTDAAVGGRRAR